MNSGFRGNEGASGALAVETIQAFGCSRSTDWVSFERARKFSNRARLASASRWSARIWTSDWFRRAASCSSLLIDCSSEETRCWVTAA